MFTCSMSASCLISIFHDDWEYICHRYLFWMIWPLGKFMLAFSSWRPIWKEEKREHRKRAAKFAGRRRIHPVGHQDACLLLVTFSYRHKRESDKWFAPGLLNFSFRLMPNHLTVLPRIQCFPFLPVVSIAGTLQKGQKINFYIQFSSIKHISHVICSQIRHSVLRTGSQSHDPLCKEEMCMVIFLLAYQK